MRRATPILIIAALMLITTAISAWPKDFYLSTLNINGTWSCPDRRDNSYGLVRRSPAHSHMLYSEIKSDEGQAKSVGGLLNLKYYAGISYEEIRKSFPGKTVSLSVFVPTGFDKDILRGLRAFVKSEKDGSWVEYADDVAWKKMPDEGSYKVSLKIPSADVKKEGGTFYPENMVLVGLEYKYPDIANKKIPICFGVSDFSIDNTAVKSEEMQWQSAKDGYAVTDSYLVQHPEGSSFLSCAGNDITLEYKIDPQNPKHELIGSLDNFNLTMNIFIPEELRKDPGIITLSINNGHGARISSFKKFNSCAFDGRVVMALPLGGLEVKSNAEEVVSAASITLRLRPIIEYKNSMMPIVIEPLIFNQGKLVPFDSTWQIRDVQGRGGYKNIRIGENNYSAENNTMGKRAGNEKSYQLDMVIPLKGGIDWNSPQYRVEVAKFFDEGPIDMSNAHLEVLISPITETTNLWQIPYRARIGILDANENIMFGPNISLSEGLPAKATLDVSTTNPIPKGFAMPYFNTKKVKAIIINLEASHAFVDVKEIGISFANLMIKPQIYQQKVPVRAIDFSKFQIDPEKWSITQLIKKSGGFVVGINYPFPNLKVPKSVMEVSQVYPTVGMKKEDTLHLGFSSPLSKEKTLQDFTLFARKDVDLVRLFTFGHTDGVFEWDATYKNIGGFSEEAEAAIAGMSKMKIEEMVAYLEKNEGLIFPKTEDGKIAGLEKHVVDDFRALLDILEEVEKKTGKRILLIMSLYDFTIADGISREGPRRKYRVGEHVELVTDAIVKTKAHCILWKLMQRLREDKRLYKYVGSMEIMNEPENATALCTRERFPELVNFVGEGLYVLKSVLGTSLPVSIGNRSWPGDLKFWSTVADGMDILMPHYWESLESYNIDTPNLWPLDMPAEVLWQCLGTLRKGRPTGIAEISPLGDIRKNIFRIYRAGYNFVLLWSYSGHDGHDSKPAMQAITDYQKANDTFNAIVKTPSRSAKTLYYVMRGVISGQKKDISDAQIVEAINKGMMAGEKGINIKGVEEALRCIINKQKVK
jgi:hypothetical protein